VIETGWQPSETGLLHPSIEFYSSSDKCQPAKCREQLPLSQVKKDVRKVAAEETRILLLTKS